MEVLTGKNLLQHTFPFLKSSKPLSFDLVAHLPYAPFYQLVLSPGQTFSFLLLWRAEGRSKACRSMDRSIIPHFFSPVLRYMHFLAPIVIFCYTSFHSGRSCSLREWVEVFSLEVYRMKSCSFTQNVSI